MRVREITENIDEGWKSTLAGVATGLGLGTGAITAYNNMQQQPPAPAPTVAAVQTVPQAAITHAQQLLSNPQAQILKRTAEAAGIKGKELAAFLAQCAHETQNFVHLKEFGGKLDFKKYDLKFNPKKAKELGNKQVGDGIKFKGRGYLHITGRWNYNQLEQALNLPLVAHPELLEKPQVAAQAAVWYWQNRVEPNVTNFDDIAATTKPINKGLRGLEDRKLKYIGLKHVLVKEPAQPKTAK
jgi:putative chitinase